MDDEADILIIGAGAAGLAAARELSAAHLKVIVLEARNRIGGRINTHFNPFPIELGGIRSWQATGDADDHRARASHAPKDPKPPLAFA